MKAGLTTVGEHAQRAGTHVVIVGSGIAGLTTALHAMASGCRVTLVTKDELEHANTRYAQGGIAGVMFADDRAEDHIADTLIAGAGLADPDAVRVLVEEGPARIQELIDLGVAFDRESDGDFVKGLEAAHSYPRILHAGGDATGTAIEHALVARLRSSGARVIEHAFLIDVLVDAAGRASGVALLVDDSPLDSRSEALGAPSPDAPGRRERIDADAIVLATGGAGELYAHTTNPSVATGDGIAAAMRAGAAVTDLEFFQFHPTVLAVGEAFLVSEAVRGEGATLIDDQGRRFCFDAHTDGELAPRDIVARAIAAQMERQAGRPVRLDATALGAEFLARRFPTIDAAVRERGLDWATEAIPVTPAAHYLMGGVTTDLFGRTSVPGLYAVGEVARTGVHGANRLASNSLLEGAVFGARAGGVIATDAAAASRALGADRAPSSDRAPGADRAPSADRAPRPPGAARAAGWEGPTHRTLAPHTLAPSPLPPIPLTPAMLAPAMPVRLRPAPALTPADRAQGAGEAARTGAFSRAALQRLMWEHAGLVRDEAGLARAAAVLEGWAAERRIPLTESEFEDENLLQLGAALVAAARARRQSVGAHFRSDEPNLGAPLTLATDTAASTAATPSTASATSGTTPSTASATTPSTPPQEAERNSGESDPAVALAPQNTSNLLTADRTPACTPDRTGATAC